MIQLSESIINFFSNVIIYMLGMFNNENCETKPKQKITDHLSNYVQNNNNQYKTEIQTIKNDLKTKTEEMQNLITEMKKECVNINDIDELITDIRNSFELFINTTHTPRQNELEKRLTDLETKYNTLFNNTNIEIIHEEEKTKKSSRVPKLEIKKK